MAERTVEAPIEVDRPSARQRWRSLPTQVLVGFLLGIAVGVFFGDMAGWLQIVGEIFIKLLQITVIPYISLSLIIGFGGLSYDMVKNLILKGGGILLVVWGIVVAILLLTPLAFPAWPSASFFNPSLIEEPRRPDFIRLFIPSNPFYAFSNALAPAIVVFSALVGFALIGVKKNKGLLTPLRVLSQAMTRITGFVSRLAPIGVFGLIASAVGTTDVEDLTRLQVYVVLYALLCLTLGFWVLPALVTVLTPFRYWDVVWALRTPLITAFATGSTLIVLPMLAERCKQLIFDAQVVSEEAQEDADSSVEVLIPTIYTFPSPGSLLTLSFVLFGGWYIGSPVQADDYSTLIIAGLPSMFGGTVLAIPFMLDLLGLPAELFQVFLSVDVVASRFNTLLGAMHYAAVALIGTLAVLGKLRLRWLPLAQFSLVSAVLFGAVLLSVHAFYTHVVVAPYTRDQALKSLRLQVEPQPAKVLGQLRTGLELAAQAPASLDEIKRRGVLRVCFFPSDYPSAFFNTAEPPQLVGFDIEMAHRFARALGLPIEFLPVGEDFNAATPLNAGLCDIVMSNTQISLESIRQFAMTVSIYESPIGLVVREELRNALRNWDDVRARGASLRVAVWGTSESIARARRLLPQAEILPFYGTDELETILGPGESNVDAIATSAENGAAWTLLYPQFGLVVPRPAVFVPIGYSVAKGNQELLKAFNAWLQIQKASGTIDAMYRYWMLGEVSAADKTPRWSVIRDVLGWVD